MSEPAILVLNAGSSSLKFQVFDLAGSALDTVLRGQIDGIGADAAFRVRDGAGRTIHAEDLDDSRLGTPQAALAHLTGWLHGALAGWRLAGVGHRVVHGGTVYSRPVRVDGTVLSTLEGLVPLAPLHQPHNLAPIRALVASDPGLPQVACFDTAFHRTQPLEAELFALPMRYYDEGVRRYGFHGLSYEHVGGRLAEIAPEIARGRVVVAHLGSGVSMCALSDGRSIATTMGFTALDGCPMGTRTGSLDAGVVLHLARERRMDLDRIEQLLYRESGLLGLSGIAADMRELESSADPRARVAIDYFTYRIAREAGSLASALGGLDALVFTAGIGENSAAVRAAVCDRLGWLGVTIDAAANRNGATRLDAVGSRVAVLRVPTDEERMIARHTRDVLGLH
jgi:acetate kinase